MLILPPLENSIEVLRRWFKAAIRRKKDRSWKAHCGSLTTLSQATRLQKILLKDLTTKLGSLRLSSKTFTVTESDIAGHLLQRHFPDSIQVEDDPELEMILKTAPSRA